jgi:hypothetical protein
MIGDSAASPPGASSKMARADGVNEFCISGQSQGGPCSAASRLRGKCENAVSQLGGAAGSGQAQRVGSLRRRSDAKWSERSITRRATRTRKPSAQWRQRERGQVLHSGRGASTTTEVLPPHSGARQDGGRGRVRGLPDETRDGERRGQDVGQEGRLGAIGATEPGRAFYAASRLVGIATFGITAATRAQVPGGRLDLEIARQAEAAIGQGQANADEIPQVGRRLAVRAGRRIGGWSRDLRRGRPFSDEDVGVGCVKATLTADPFAIAAFVIVAVESEPITKGTQGIAQGVIAAFEARSGSHRALIEYSQFIDKSINRLCPLVDLSLRGETDEPRMPTPPSLTARA